MCSSSSAIDVWPVCRCWHDPLGRANSGKLANNFGRLNGGSKTVKLQFPEDDVCAVGQHLDDQLSHNYKPLYMMGRRRSAGIVTVVGSKSAYELLPTLINFVLLKAALMPI